MPILFPLKAGFGEADWLAGFILALVLVGAGLLALYRASSKLNLSRAAQESRFRWAIQQASWLGDSRLILQMKARQKLGAGHPASQIRGKAGSSSLIWKDWVTTLRTMNFSTITGWLSIFGVYLGMILVSDWGVRLLAFIIWCLLVGQRCTARLRSDLEVWGITRQLPFGRETLVAEVARPILGAMLLTWCALGVRSWLGLSTQLSNIILAPAAIICIVLAAEFDILRQCRSSDLVAGQVAELGAGGLVIGVILAGIPPIIITWLTSQFKPLGIIWIGNLLGIVLSFWIIYVLWNLIAAKYRDIK
jgi:hypothetical protein